MKKLKVLIKPRNTQKAIGKEIAKRANNKYRRAEFLTHQKGEIKWGILVTK
jgi:hypothetical protein